MADNYTTNLGSGGDTYAADEILGVKFPRVKFTLGADGSNDGDVSATNKMPVTGTLSVSAVPQSSTSNNVAQTAVTTTSAQVLATNASRKKGIFQNTGTTVIKLGLGRTPTQTAYHIALKACASQDDGSGGTYIDSNWTGAVNAVSSSTGGTMVVTEQT